MGARSRRKGAAGERELIGLLRDQLGDRPELRRNLDQCRDGGADCRVAGHAIEVKRAERFLSAWLDQAEAQAGDDIPVVAWRRNGGRWRFLVVQTVGQFAEQVREHLSSVLTHLPDSEAHPAADSLRRALLEAPSNTTGANL